MNKRNSLIELFRFIFAMNVVKGHGYFPIDVPYFGPARISVEFFFVLSGFLLMRSIAKHTGKSYRRGILGFMLAKIKPLAIPLLVALPFNIWYEIAESNGSFNLWGYLWYVHIMLIYFAVYFTLKYFIKRERLFVITVAAVAVVCSALHATEFFFSWGIIRGGMGISIGILISYLPSIKTQKRWWLPIPVAVFAAASALVLTFYYADEGLVENLLDLVIYPGLVYFTFQINVSNKFLDYLGALSFGLYAFQCVVRPLDLLGIWNVGVYFGIIVALTLIEDGGKRLFKRYRVAQAFPEKTRIQHRL